MQKQNTIEDDNIYENSIPGYGETQKNVSSEDSSESKKRAEKYRSVVQYIQWAVLCLALVIIIAILISVKVEQNATGETLRKNFEELKAANAMMNESTYSETTTTHYNIETTLAPTSTSCFDLNAQGMTNDGMYDVLLPGDSLPVKVYCDMTTDGGGWTLVASVHEDDISRKCDSNDVWSTYRDRANTTGKYNWANEFTFGKVRNLHKEDYKNTGYYSLKGSDVMIWHAKSNVQIASLKTSTKLRYRTNNGFLANYGGNLQTLYDLHYPLRVDSATEYLNGTRRRQVANVLDVLQNNSASIRSRFLSYYQYSYSSNDRISDSNVYLTSGNLVTMYNTICYTNLVYNLTDDCFGDFAVVSSRKSQPFFAVAFITNADLKSEDFTTRVTSYRSSSENTTTHSNTLTEGDFKLQYRVIQYSGSSSYYTICEFHFVVSSSKIWGSVEPTSFYLLSQYTNTQNKQTNHRITGTPSNIIMGYTLLANQTTTQISNSSMDSVGREILKTFANMTLFKPDENHSGLSVPVTFDLGTSADVINMTPPNFRMFIDIGFIQFRSYNPSGFPNALCPGVRVKSTRASPYVCIGGISSSLEEHGTCGDFAGWNGKAGDIVMTNKAIGSAHSFEDISSPILIFYR